MFAASRWVNGFVCYGPLEILCKTIRAEKMAAWLGFKHFGLWFLAHTRDTFCKHWDSLFCVVVSLDLVAFHALGAAWSVAFVILSLVGSKILKGLFLRGRFLSSPFFGLSLSQLSIE